MLIDSSVSYKHLAHATEAIAPQTLKPFPPLHHLKLMSRITCVGRIQKECDTLLGGSQDQYLACQGCDVLGGTPANIPSVSVSD